MEDSQTIEKRSIRWHFNHYGDSALGSFPQLSVHILQETWWEADAEAERNCF